MQFLSRSTLGIIFVVAAVVVVDTSKPDSFSHVRNVAHVTFSAAVKLIWYHDRRLFSNSTVTTRAAHSVAASTSPLLSRTFSRPERRQLAALTPCAERRCLLLCWLAALLFLVPIGASAMQRRV